LQKQVVEGKPAATAADDGDAGDEKTALCACERA
jgi:hypothetical protein